MSEMAMQTLHSERAVREREHIGTDINALEAEISMLTESIAVLGKHLEPVLQPELPTESLAMKAGADGQPMSQTRLSLQSAARQIAYLRREVGKFQDRLDV